MMITFKRILVPTDFGDSAERAVDFAIELASKFDSKVTLLHVSWTQPAVYASYEGLFWPREEIDTLAQKGLDRELARAKTRYANVEGIVIPGDPIPVILDIAANRGADLIVMGTHGHKGLTRVLLGSVAEKIVRLSPVPVLTVSSQEAQASRAQGVL